MKHIKEYNEFVNENKKSLPFRNELLYKDSNIGKYELYLDGSTGWGIIFPSGYLEVEEGPHESAGFMNGEINGIAVSTKSYNVPRIPSKYWEGNMSNSQLKSFFDKVIKKYKNVTG